MELALLVGTREQAAVQLLLCWAQGCGICLGSRQGQHQPGSSASKVMRSCVTPEPP